MIFSAAFPSPEPTVFLTKNGGRFQDGQIRGDRFHNFRRKICIVEGERKLLSGGSEGRIVAVPMVGEFFNARETTRVPRLVRSRDRSAADDVATDDVAVGRYVGRLEEI